MIFSSCYRDLDSSKEELSRAFEEKTHAASSKEEALHSEVARTGQMLAQTQARWLAATVVEPIRARDTLRDHEKPLESRAMFTEALRNLDTLGAALKSSAASLQVAGHSMPSVHTGQILNMSNNGAGGYTQLEARAMQQARLSVPLEQTIQLSVRGASAGQEPNSHIRERPERKSKTPLRAEVYWENQLASAQRQVQSMVAALTSKAAGAPPMLLFTVVWFESS